MTKTVEELAQTLTETMREIGALPVEVGQAFTDAMQAAGNMEEDDLLSLGAGRVVTLYEMVSEIEVTDVE